MRRLFCCFVVVCSVAAHYPSDAGAFALVEHDLTFSAAGGSASMLAGSHSFLQSTSISFEAEPGENGTERPAGALKDLNVSLPPGFVGDTTAITPCTTSDFTAEDCPNAAKIGMSVTHLFEPGAPALPATVYYLEAPPGIAARLGFRVTRVPVIIDLKVNAAFPYNVVATLHDTPNAVPIYSSIVTIEGEPLAAPKPFLTLPRACMGPLSAQFQAFSWEEPLVGTPLESSTTALSTTGCQDLGFPVTIDASGTNSRSESPSGLDFDLNVKDPGLTESGGRAASDIERVAVTLPRGFTTNPSVANGLSACSLAQYRSEGVQFEPFVGCPASSAVGSVSVTSPLLAEKLTGQIYVAKQGENETDDSLLSLYMVLRNEARGILVKQAVKIEPDATSGQLRSTVSQIPQLPFSNFHLHFRSGQRAPLISPATCGQYTVQADIYPYAQGVPAVHGTASLTVSSGANGTSCVSGEVQLPNALSFSAGTMASTAGSYSPFLLNLSRPDGSQHISEIQTTLPAGLLGKLAGVPYCPESGIAEATSREGESEGLSELSAPSCPAASQIGTITALTGAGSEPLAVKGKAYLAGPYRGAPLSLEIVTPAIAGPFDLGVVAVRTALKIEPITAQITAESDPIPAVLHGLPLDLRSISIDIDRPGFTLNPTSCEPKAIIGSATSTLGSVAPLSQYFQASDCAALAFRPKLKLSLSGSTNHAGHPALKAVLSYPKGASNANIARAQVNLPRSVFIDQANLNKTCTKPVLLEGRCPAKSIYGKAKAWSPLLEAPLSGNVYLVGGFGYKLPALVAELDGQIRVLLVGKVDSGPNKGIRNTFETVPDAPVEKFELRLKGGKKYSLLENSEDLCRRPQKAIVRFTAQNGRVQQTRPKLALSCPRRKSNRPRGRR